MALREEVRVLKLEKDRIRHMHKSGTASPDDTKEFKKAFKYAFLTSIASSPKTLDEATLHCLIFSLSFLGQYQIHVRER